MKTNIILIGLIFLIFHSEAAEKFLITVNLPALPQEAKPLEMVLIPKGEFTMGANPDDKARYDNLEWSAHHVKITQDFYIGKFEITQAQWTALMNSNPAHDAGVGLNYPVYLISYKEIQQFIVKLNQTSQGHFRLPTEAEWEYACRAGTTSRFSFSEKIEIGEGYNFDPVLDVFMWWFGNCRDTGCKPVGQKVPNPWNLYDMHGNLYEWCSDWWELPHPRDFAQDPEGPSVGNVHVVRGGHWYGTARHCRSAFRFFEQDAEEHGGVFYGFRLVRDVGPSGIKNWSMNKDYNSSIEGIVNPL